MSDLVPMVVKRVVSRSTGMESHTPSVCTRRRKIHTKKKSRKSRKSRKSTKSRKSNSRKSNINQKAGGNYYENTRYQQPAYPELDDPNVKTTYNIDKAYDNLIHGREIDNSNYLNIDNTISSNFENGSITDQVDYTYALSEQCFS